MSESSVPNGTGFGLSICSLQGNFGETFTLLKDTLFSSIKLLDYLIILPRKFPLQSLGVIYRLGLHWNANPSAIPILCLHGWKDNAASFNRIIPKLLGMTTKYQFLAIDLPGHGFSSHYPGGMLYQVVDSMLAIRRVMRHFGWAENPRGIHLLGHSLGAILSFVFTATHPKLVDCMIAIDALAPVLFSHADMAHTIEFITEGILLTELSDIRATTYDKSELLKKMRESHMMGLDPVACDTLFTRAVIESPPNSGRYKFSHDPRVQFYPILGFSMDQIKFLAECFQSNLLHIKAEHGVTYLSDYMQENLRNWIIKDNKKVVQFTIAKQANHHVHLGEPEKIIPDIIHFLNTAHSTE